MSASVMEATQKRRQAEQVRRALDRLLKPAGWRRGKPTVWVRGMGPVRPFLHLHLFSFEPAFRLHLGWRVMASGFPALALNGPACEGHEDGGPRFHFAHDAASVSRCAEAMADWMAAVGEPWFARCATPQHLLREGSPLDADERALLRDALAGVPEERAEALSRRLLGCLEPP